jgi:hypothetical protein
MQLWLIPTVSNKLTNTAWPCVIDVWITVFCLYGNYKMNVTVKFTMQSIDWPWQKFNITVFCKYNVHHNNNRFNQNLLF